MDMQNYTTPFANTGDKEEFSIDTDPSGKVSLEKGWTELYQLRPEEGGLFILRKVFNQMMKLVSTDTVTWKIQSFPNWIADKGDGTPYAYPKNTIVKYTDGNTYVSKVDNNTTIPTDTNNWVNFEDFGTININALPNKPTPVDTDNIAIQETGGLLKKLSFANLKATLNVIYANFVPYDSRVKTSLNAGGQAPIYACRAWVNFNGTGTVAIRASGNVSSITDNGVGNYTANFTTAMEDANYSFSGDGNNGSLNLVCCCLSKLTTSCNIRTSNSISGNITSNNFLDLENITFGIFR